MGSAEYLVALKNAAPKWSYAKYLKRCGYEI